MSAFTAAIFAIVANIPCGKVVSYGQIARFLGKPRASRVVGTAMHYAPKERGLPCHRVVNRLGEMSPHYVFGDKDWQRAMLESEGVGFLNNGCVDMKKFEWNIEIEECVFSDFITEKR